MTPPAPRTQEGYLQFLLYLDETGLDPELREICRAHRVTPRDIYLDGRGPTTHAARVECWWWLLATTRKSQNEVARIFDREPASVGYAMRRLGAAARALGVELNASTARRCAVAMAERAHANARASGARVQVLGTGTPASLRSRAIKPGA